MNRSSLPPGETTRVRAPIFSAVAALALAGCITAPGGVAPSNVPLEGRSHRVIGETSGSDSAIRLFGILPISDSNDIRDAIEDAKRKVGADALIEITVDTYTQWWVIFTRHATRVQAVGIESD